MPTRRALLTTGMLIVISGCSTLGGASARIARVRLQNNDSTPHEFELTLTVDGETVYDVAHTVDEEDGSTVELLDELPDERGTITIETRLSDVDISESTTFDDDTCYDVIVEYTGDNLIHWQSGSDGCEAFVTE